MKRSLPIWIAAVLPAALAGHGLAYAVSGRTAADPRHLWVVPALECSIALLLAVATILAGASLMRARVLRHTAVERSFWALWPRLALAQIAVFTIMESLEGARVGMGGVVVQLAVAALAACLLSLFARLIQRVRAAADEAGTYLEREREKPLAFLSLAAAPAAGTLAVRAGTSRFQRPPPHN